MGAAGFDQPGYWWAMSQENVELAQRTAEAINRRDLDAYLAVMDDDVIAAPRVGVVEGDLHGHGGIRRWWENLFDVFPDFTVEIVETRDLGDVLLAAAHVRGRGAGGDAPLEETLWYAARMQDGSASGGPHSNPERRPSKPWGCGSRRCRRRTWRS